MTQSAEPSSLDVILLALQNHLQKVLDNHQILDEQEGLQDSPFYVTELLKCVHK